MYCGKCGKEVKEEWNFCNYCGNKLNGDSNETKKVMQIDNEVKSNKTIKCNVCDKEIPYNENGTCEECHQEILRRIESKNIQQEFSATGNIEKLDKIENFENNIEKHDSNRRSKIEITMIIMIALFMIFVTSILILLEESPYIIFFIIFVIFCIFIIGFSYLCKMHSRLNFIWEKIKFENIPYNIKLDNDFILYATQNLIAKNLTTQEEIKWNDMRILDKDSYGKYLVYVNFASKNAFGTYINSYWLVPIKINENHMEYSFKSYPKFFYINNEEELKSNFILNNCKKRSNWNKQTMSEDEYSEKYKFKNTLKNIVKMIKDWRMYFKTHKKVSAFLIICIMCVGLYANSLRREDVSSLDGITTSENVNQIENNKDDSTTNNSFKYTAETIQPNVTEMTEICSEIIDKSKSKIETLLDLQPVTEVKEGITHNFTPGNLNMTSYTVELIMNKKGELNNVIVSMYFNGTTTDSMYYNGYSTYLKTEEYKQDIVFAFSVNPQNYEDVTRIGYIYGIRTNWANDNSLLSGQEYTYELSKEGTTYIKGDRKNWFFVNCKISDNTINYNYVREEMEPYYTEVPINN